MEQESPKVSSEDIFFIREISENKIKLEHIERGGGHLAGLQNINRTPVAQRYHVTSDTLGREFDPGKRDFSH